MTAIRCVCHVFRFLGGWNGCCWSCHDDADGGWGDLSEYMVRGEVVEVCCRIGNDFFPDSEHDDRNAHCACRGCMAVVKPVIRDARVWWEAA